MVLDEVLPEFLDTTSFESAPSRFREINLHELRPARLHRSPLTTEARHVRVNHCTPSAYPWRLSPRTSTGADEASIVLTRTWPYC